MDRLCLLSLNDPSGYADKYVGHLICEMQKIAVVYAICRSDYKGRQIAYGDNLNTIVDAYEDMNNNGGPAELPEERCWHSGGEASHG